MRHLLLGLFVFLACLNARETCASEPVDAFQAGKTRLVNKLETEIKAYEKDADDLKTATAGQSNLQLAIDPKQFLREMTKRLELQRVFLAAINQEDAQHIPALLMTSYQSCDHGVCLNGLDASLLDDAIVAFGVLALQSLLDNVQTLPAPKKEGVLNLTLQVEPRQCPSTILDTALRDPEFRVRAAALKVYKNNCTVDAFFQHLDQLLAAETNPEFLIYLLSEVPEDSVESARFHNVLLRLIQEKRIPVDVGFTKLCAAAMTSVKLDADAIDIPFWLDVFTTQPLRQSCLIDNIFLKFNQEKHLIKLRSLLRTAAEHRYHFGAEQNLYGVTPASHLAYWDSIPGADEKMVTAFQQQVSRKTLRAWAGAADTPLGEKLLLARWLGDDPTKLLSHLLKLQIDVRSTASVVVATTTQEVKLNQPFTFTVAPQSPGFQKINYRGTVRFDKDKLNYTIENFIVGLSPAGAGFAPVIPIDGSFRADLLVHQEKYKWTITIGGAPEK
jgi:hypothetical protein